MKKIKSKAKMVAVYDAKDFFEKGQEAKPAGRMRDPDTTIGLVLDRATLERLLRKKKSS